MGPYIGVEGMVTNINPLASAGRQESCVLMISIRDNEGRVNNFVTNADTYFVDHEGVERGDRAIFFYDSSRPVPLIYPPQYTAVAAARAQRGRNIAVDTFNRDMVSSDGALKLNMTRRTPVQMTNGQTYPCRFTDKPLVVVYTNSTRSIPAQVMPVSVTVLDE